ncbi:ArsR family transcriptional regulator [Paucibacter sp. TC2R-5]|uniref:ArsR family transcriptional regulator n=1 Tax=Paucibacter sp. TC2R-5 TaxID=2893555 RepID=UPI0021E43F86|nr:ArsR family transcriptional regulator [Paucibacter sp. TC2R-5]MCV2359646.1 ArsR family transcriptional regulator [Paucibacter sp. TC2R-5]
MSHRDLAAARRRHVLATLWFAPASTANVQWLQRELLTLSSINASADQVRGDLTWLQEQGFVQFSQDMAKTTERGADVVRGAAAWPGE